MAKLEGITKFTGAIGDLVAYELMLLKRVNVGRNRLNGPFCMILCKRSIRINKDLCRLRKITKDYGRTIHESSTIARLCVMDTDFELTFNTQKQHHLLSLTQSYEALVEAAYDKEYASRAYAESLFEPILSWKNVSLYFERVLGLVVHYSKIDPSSVIRLTIANIAELKSEVYDALPIFDETDAVALPELYFLQLSDVDLIDHIAKFSAAFDLSRSLAPKEPEIIEASVVEKKKIHHFTRNQQLLALYYTLKPLGIEPRKTTDMTNYARFVHLLAGVDFNKVENDIFYTKIQKLPNILTDTYLKKDLEFIRSYFLSIEAHSIVEQIDLEIKGCSDNF